MNVSNNFIHTGEQFRAKARLYLPLAWAGFAVLWLFLFHPSTAAILHILRVGFGSLLSLFFPGFFLTFFAFPSHEPLWGKQGASETSGRPLDIIERVVLAVIFSIIISSAVVFALSKGVAGTSLASAYLWFSLGSVVMIAGALACWRKQWMGWLFCALVALFPMAVFLIHYAVDLVFTFAILVKEVAIFVMVMILTWFMAWWRQRKRESQVNLAVDK